MCDQQEGVFFSTPLEQQEEGPSNKLQYEDTVCAVDSFVGFACRFIAPADEGGRR